MIVNSGRPLDAARDEQSAIGFDQPVPGEPEFDLSPRVESRQLNAESEELPYSHV